VIYDFCDTFSQYRKKIELVQARCDALREKNSFTLDALPVVVVEMKVRSWYLVILAVFAVLTLSSCALNQEGVAPNPAEVPDTR